MTLAITPLGDCLGAAATGVDLRDATAEEIGVLAAALDRHVVLCVRDQQLTPAALLAAARRFGDPVTQVNAHLALPELPEISIVGSDITDVHGGGARHISGTTWHTDQSFTARPAKATLLYAVVIPESGGDTSFCNTRAGYAALPETTKARIDGLRAVHCYQSSRSPRPMLTRTAEEEAMTPDVIHPLVRTHPTTGDKALYMSTTRLDRILDMERAESDALIDELMAHATQARFQYHHKWRHGDLVIWDNRCSMHHANADYPPDAGRLLQRAMLAGEIPV